MIDKLKSLIKKKNVQQFIKYLFVGGTSFLLDYGLFLLLYKQFGVFEVYANAISVFVAFWYNFLLNKFWSFESNDDFFKQILYYLALMFFNMLFSSGFIYIIDKRVGISPVIGKVIAMVLIVGWNFILYKTVIFKSKNSKK